MIRTRPRRSAAPLAAVAALLLTGCGGPGGPHMARGDVAPLIKLADQIGLEAPCAQVRDIRALRAQTIALVNAHRIPAALQEPLISGVNALVEPACVPAAIPSTGGHGHGHGGGGGDNGGGGGGGD